MPPLPPPSKLDSTQVLQHVYDESLAALRVNTGATINVEGVLEVAIDATTDSIKIHGNDPAGVDRTVKTSEDGSIDIDGVYNSSINTEPANIGLVAHTRVVSPGDSNQNKRLTAITSSTVHALDVSLHDENGNAYSPTNPLQVVVIESEGDEINDYQTSAAVAAGSFVDLNYTVAALKTLQLTQFHGSASGRAKFELKIETGVGTSVFNTKFVFFNSTVNPNVDISLKDPIAVLAGIRVRVTITNRDNQPQDVYSTVSGHEV